MDSAGAASQGEAKAFASRDTPLPVAAVGVFAQAAVAADQGIGQCLARRSRRQHGGGARLPRRCACGMLAPQRVVVAAKVADVHNLRMAGNMS